MKLTEADMKITVLSESKSGFCGFFLSFSVAVLMEKGGQCHQWFPLPSACTEILM